MDAALEEMLSLREARHVEAAALEDARRVREQGPVLEAEVDVVAKPSLGNRLRVARAERDMSQDELARLAGVTRQTISSIETGQYGPSALLAFLLARALDKPVAELFFLQMDGGAR